MNVCECFGNAPVKGRFGIEVEVEGQNLPQEIPQQWIAEKDNSLRGESAEYILRVPLDRKEANNAIMELKDALSKSTLSFSHRTSVHVHVNVSEFTRNELLVFLYLAYLFDSVMYQYAGRKIAGNRFCLRLIDAQDTVRFLERLASEPNRIPLPQNEQAKYAAVNIVPIGKYGSVEFRAMAGTMNTIRLRNWLAMLEKLVDFSQKYSTIEEMMASFNNDELAFVKNVFGAKLSGLLINENTINLLRMNYSCLINIMYSAKYQKNAEKKVDKGVFKAALEGHWDLPQHVNAAPRPINPLAGLDEPVQYKYVRDHNGDVIKVPVDQAVQRPHNWEVDPAVYMNREPMPIMNGRVPDPPMFIIDDLGVRDADIDPFAPPQMPKVAIP